MIEDMATCELNAFMLLDLYTHIKYGFLLYMRFLLTDTKYAL